MFGFGVMDNDRRIDIGSMTEFVAIDCCYSVTTNSFQSFRI